MQAQVEALNNLSILYDIFRMAHGGGLFSNSYLAYLANLSSSHTISVSVVGFIC
jgi:hypothetical protein